MEDPRIARLVEELATGKDLGDHPPPAVLLLNKVSGVGVLWIALGCPCVCVWL